MALSITSGPSWGPASGGAPRQLVVLVHGLGADGADLIELAPHWGGALPDAVFLAPDAPEACDMGPTGRQWFSVADRAPARMLAGVAAAARALDAFVDAAVQRFGVPATEVALMGFSQGAMTVLHAGLRRVPPPRAILAYSGALIAPDALAAELAAKVPVLLVHGEDDETVPIARSHAAEAALRQAGVPVETLWRPHLAHGVDPEGIAAGARALRAAFGVAGAT